MGTVSNRKSASRASGVRKTRVADGKTESKSRIKPNFRLILGWSAVGAVVSLFIIPILTERPERGQKLAARSGGESVVEKSGTPRATRGLAPSMPSRTQSQPPPVAAAPDLTSDTLPPGVTLSGPGFDLPGMRAPAEAPPGQPFFPEALSLPGELSSPSREQAAPPPLPARTPDSAAPRQQQPETGNAPRAALPWQSGTPGRESGGQDLANLPPRTQTGPSELPGRSDIRGWARSTAREFVGGVDADGMPLYRFDVWLDAPDNMRSQIRSVSYEYRAPSAQPPSQSSSEAGSGFRVKFGAASCAEKAMITVIMNDGQQRSVDVDGCGILN